ncbi:MAG TPA: DUF1697 domain-containing protein [Caulobacteraceae bacterium]|jgi:uncharacterized protein (DUF1697 family)
MADLRAAFTELGLMDVRTLLASGNLVFEASGEKAAALEARVEKALADKLDLTTEVFVRTTGQWRAMIADNPFERAAREDPARLIAMILREAPDPGAPERLNAAIVGREEAKVVGRVAFIVYPDGAGQSAFTGARLDRALGVRGTGRNWNTVIKLAEMAGAA